MERELVSPGDYIIVSFGEHKILEALLLTCVGVAVYDRCAGVGGLCHILLPDSPELANHAQPKICASSCLEVFIEGLCQRGAMSSRLEAVVAGGALDIPFTQYDLNLDIGGRVGECVFDYLRRHSIPVKNSETGGCVGMKISLNPLSWNVSITHAFPEAEGNTSIVKPSPQEIREAVVRVTPIPQITLRLIRILHEGNYDIAGVAELIRQDQVLSAKVLSYCNSALVNPREKIDSIERATLVMGELHLLEIVIATSLHSFFERQVGGYSLVKGGMFKHAVAVAFLTKVIARKVRCVDFNASYTAGLLHDIGKVVLDQFVAQARPLFYCGKRDNEDDLIQIEQNVFGIDHQQVGGGLAALFNLPDNLGEVVSLHHYPEKAVVDPELTHAVNLADLLATWFMAGYEIEKIDARKLGNRMARIGLSVTHIPEIIGSVPWAKLMYI